MEGSTISPNMRSSRGKGALPPWSRQRSRAERPIIARPKKQCQRNVRHFLGAASRPRNTRETTSNGLDTGSAKVLPASSGPATGHSIPDPSLSGNDKVVQPRLKLPISDSQPPQACVTAGPVCELGVGSCLTRADAHAVERTIDEHDRHDEEQDGQGVAHAFALLLAQPYR